MRATGPLLAFQLAERKRARFFKRCDRMGTEIIVGVGHDVATPGSGECSRECSGSPVTVVFDYRFNSTIASRLNMRRQSASTISGATPVC